MCLKISILLYHFEQKRRRILSNEYKVPDLNPDGSIDGDALTTSEEVDDIDLHILAEQLSAQKR